MDARVEASDAVPGGRIALGVVAATWVAVVAVYLGHRIVLSSDSMNNYVHVWWIAHDLWHHGRLPWRMPVLGHGAAYAFPYGFTNWTVSALLWPLFGNWAVTLSTALGAAGCVVATFLAFPELRRGWWAAAVIANPAIIEALLFGQQTFAWGSALLLLGIACWRRKRRLAAALLVGLGQATHAAIVLPIGVLLVLIYVLVDVASRHSSATPREPDRHYLGAAAWELVRWYSLSLLITLPAVVLVFASPGYADSTTRDRIVNFVATLAPRLGIVALPVIFVLMRRTGRRALAPLALVVSLVANAGLHQPLNVAFQWGALTRSVSTASLDDFLHSRQFDPGATYRVLRGAGDGKLGLYHVVLAGGRLDSELFPESMAMHSFRNLTEYEQLLCARHVDFVIAYTSYTASRRTNELALLARLAAGSGRTVRVEPIERGKGHVVYRVNRAACPPAR